MPVLELVTRFDIFAEGRALAVDDPDMKRAEGTAYRWLHFDVSSNAAAEWMRTNLPAIPA
ncbi:MAG: hypothetical protein AAF340_06815 [Pseudomonadota bacterium]